jgi:hypothetical protein
VLVTQLEAKKHGYADVVYLDAKTDTFLEEVSSCNVFAVKGKKIITPPLQVRGRGQGRCGAMWGGGEGGGVQAAGEPGEGGGL